MRFFTHLNPSEIERAGWTATMHNLCLVETAVIFSSFVPIILISFLNLQHRIFHWNANLIVGVYTLQYILSCSARLLLIGEQLTYFQLDYTTVEIANFIRSGCHFLSFYVLPAFLFERFCASYFLSDYEKKTRLWIPLLAVGSLFSLTVLSSFLFTGRYASLFLIFLTVISINITSYIGLILVHRYNIRLHKETLNRTTIHRYSLSERFQIAENIKTSELLAKVQLLLFVFSLSCALTLVVYSFDCETGTLVLVFSTFNFLCVVYGFLVPFICVTRVPVWQRELRKMGHRILCRKESTPVRHLKSTTTGEQLSFHAGTNQADVYFTQFQSMLQDKSPTNSVVPVRN